MTDIIEKHQETAHAPAPQVLGGSNTSQLVIHWPGGKGGAKTISLESLIPAAYSGLGTVDLISLEISYVATAEKQRIYAGLRTTLQTKLSAKMLGVTKAGIVYRSTAYNYGENHIAELVPPAIGSMQIRPIPSDRPALELMLDITDGMDWEIKLTIAIKDTMIHWAETLNLA